MADIQAWLDIDKLFNLNTDLNQSLVNYKFLFERLGKFKQEVLDNVERKAELKRLIDEHPNWTMVKIRDKYEEFKAIYDYLTEGE